MRVFWRQGFEAVASRVAYFEQGLVASYEIALPNYHFPEIGAIPTQWRDGARETEGTPFPN